MREKMFYLPGLNRKLIVYVNRVVGFGVIALLSLCLSNAHAATQLQKTGTKRLVYLVSDIRIPFWDIMARGIARQSKTLGYEIEILSANNSAKTELKNTVTAINKGVSGIIVSPTNSSACVTILKLAEDARIPVVISDIGTDSGKYVSYISSNNRDGAYRIGQVLARRMVELGRQDARVGIIAIPQKRKNGQDRTAGFMQALNEAEIKGADIKQQRTFSYQETYDFSINLIDKYSDLGAIWLQGSDRYKGALDAITKAGKTGEILLLTFDAEPEFLDLIPRGVLVGAAMQQPYLMGSEAVSAMDDFLKGNYVERELKLPILAISAKNISKNLPVIKKNVLGIETE